MASEMTNAEKLRALIPDWIRDSHLSDDQTVVDTANFLFHIASLLDAVPPETLAALKAGTWKAVPVELTEKMINACWELDHHPAVSGVRSHWYSFLKAAPAKPEG